MGARPLEDHQLMEILRDGGDAKEVYEHLRAVEIEYMGGELSGADRLREVTYAVCGWYEESTRRWAGRDPL